LIDFKQYQYLLFVSTFWQETLNTWSVLKYLSFELSVFEERKIIKENEKIEKKIRKEKSELCKT